MSAPAGTAEEEEEDESHCPQRKAVESCDQLHDAAPIAQAVADQADSDTSQHRPRRIEEEEAGVGHAEDTGEGGWQVPSAR